MSRAADEDDEEPVEFVCRFKVLTFRHYLIYFIDIFYLTSAGVGAATRAGVGSAGI